MALIPQITCRRCGHRFSSLRRRCPNCGTIRVQQSSRVPGTTPSAVKGTAANAAVQDNRRWQIIFGGILVLAVIIALIVMISVSLKDADASDNTPVLPSETPAAATPTPDATPTPTPTATPTVSQLKICHYSDEVSDITVTISSGTLQLTASAYPLNIDTGEASWTSSDATLFTVDNTGLVTPVGPGSATLTLELYGVSATCVIRVRN